MCQVDATDCTHRGHHAVGRLVRCMRRYRPKLILMCCNHMPKPNRQAFFSSFWGSAFPQVHLVAASRSSRISFLNALGNSCETLTRLKCITAGRDFGNYLGHLKNFLNYLSLLFPNKMKGPGPMFKADKNTVDLTETGIGGVQKAFPLNLSFNTCVQLGALSDEGH